MKLTRIRYSEWEATPFGYGLAWHDWWRQEIVVLPIPLNMIAGLARRLYLWASYPWRQSMTANERYFYERGVRDGQVIRDA